MFKASHSTLVFLSGFVWLAVGCFLLSLGLNFIVESILIENLTTIRHPILDFLSSYAGGMDQAALVWIVFALCVGFLKGRYVFAKSVQRSVNRIQTLPNPASLSKIYTLQYYLLLGSMFFLGFLVRFTTLDIRGGVDVIIGFALINGAVLYFRQSWAIRQAQLKVRG
jgi:hypothetical protein